MSNLGLDKNDANSWWNEIRQNYYTQLIFTYLKYFLQFINWTSTYLIINHIFLYSQVTCTNSSILCILSYLSRSVRKESPERVSRKPIIRRLWMTIIWSYKCLFILPYLCYLCDMRSRCMLRDRWQTRFL